MKRNHAIRFASMQVLGMILIAVPSWAIQPTNRILDQPGSPVKILSYNAFYPKKGLPEKEGITHMVHYENVSGRDIVAVEIALISFDVWDHFLDGKWGTKIKEIKRGDRNEDVWISPNDAGFTFFTGTAYVNRVRFDDGKIWSADLNQILKQLQRIDRAITITTLKGGGRL